MVKGKDQEYEFLRQKGKTCNFNYYYGNYRGNDRNDGDPVSGVRL